MTEKILSQVQAAEMGILRRVHCVTLRDKVRSCEPRKSCISSRIICNRESVPCWFGDVSRMSHERLVMQVRLTSHTGKWTRVRPTTRCSDCILNLAWSRLCVESAELSEIAVDREAFCIHLKSLSPWPSLENKQAWKNSRLNGLAMEMCFRKQQTKHLLSVRVLSRTSFKVFGSFSSLLFHS